MRVRRLHDLRHTFGSIAVRKLGPVTVQAPMGHSSLSTTVRYLHGRPRPDDAARLEAAFDSACEIQPGLRAKAQPKPGRKPSLNLKLTIKLKH